MVKQIVLQLAGVLCLALLVNTGTAQSTSGDKDYNKMLEELVAEDVEKAAQFADSLLNTKVLEDTSFFEGVYKHLIPAMQYGSEQESNMELLDKMMNHYTYKRDPLRNLLLQGRMAVSLRNSNKRLSLKSY